MLTLAADGRRSLLLQVWPAFVPRPAGGVLGPGPIGLRRVQLSQRLRLKRALAAVNALGSGTLGATALLFPRGTPAPLPVFRPALVSPQLLLLRQVWELR